MRITTALELPLGEGDGEGEGEGVGAGVGAGVGDVDGGFDEDGGADGDEAADGDGLAVDPPVHAVIIKATRPNTTRASGDDFFMLA
jgi:hypothetical protein